MPFYTPPSIYTNPNSTPIMSLTYSNSLLCSSSPLPFFSSIKAQNLEWSLVFIINTCKYIADVQGITATNQEHTSSKTIPSLHVMAKTGHQPQPNPRMHFLLMFLFIFNSSTILQADQELDLLLSFKSSINDPSHHLSNWNPSTTFFCSWHGITCSNSSSSSSSYDHITAIDLSGKNISGKVSPSIFRLSYIERINLHGNELSGELPANLFSSSTLKHLNLSNNNLTGPIPRGSSSTLETLDLYNNILSGEIPEGIGLFWSLKYLDLGGNVLVGRIPISITNLTGLQLLTLAGNQLTGQIPKEVGQMRSLKWIYMGYNNLSGSIPEEFGDLTSLYHLNLVYNNLTGQIPPSLGNLSNLQFLFLYQNKLTGSVPESIFGLQKLISLDLSDNFLSGEIPEHIAQLQKLEILHLFSNNFTGKIPTALNSLKHLQVLQLWSNKLSGEIPGDLGKQNNLTILDLSTNSLVGKIPEGLCNSGNLSKLILFSNLLEGEIPRNLSTCTSLRRVRLQDNNLSGELQSEFTQLPLVYFLDISGNNLSGRIDARKWEMPSLQMLNLARNRFLGGLPNSFGSNKLENLDLSDNKFSGSIPSGFGNLSSLMQLKLRKNELSGEIPQELSSCKKLVSLDLSQNQLNGKLPDSLSEMPVLGRLDLSNNQLSGEIPPNLGKVESLVEVNISHNHFHGKLPSTGAFLAINASSVSGNNLCGGETIIGLAPCKKAKTSIWWFAAACVLGGLLLTGLLTGFAILLIRGQKNLELKRVENEDGLWELQFFHAKVSKSITIDDILSSTKEENVISRGKRGVTYKGKSLISGMSFVVEKLLNDVHSIPPNLWVEISEYGKIQHPNIVKLIGLCRTNTTAYSIYEHIEGKNLSEILGNLSWEKRRKIAVGVAKALRFLHFHCSRRVLVGYISPEKVMVDYKDEPHLRLNLPHLFPYDAKSFISSAYLAPETRESKDMTEKSDMYGFGLILIQLLTGKSPSSSEFGLHETVVEWARYCYSDCHLDQWIDPMIRGQVLDNQNDVVQAMNLALQCTATEPTARPTADQVSKTLNSAFVRTRSCFS